MNEKLIIKNNIKISTLLGWEINKDFKTSVVYKHKNYPRDPVMEFGFKYHEDWNVLIEAFNIFKDANTYLWFSEFSNLNTRFLLGVGSNDIKKSYSALVDLSNNPKFKKP